ncbi:MAG: PEP-CTERM sorting domain-containing protein [Phycisphaerae bacterium]
MIASPALAGPWTSPSGNQDSFGNPLDFTYSNGGDINGFFGDPLLIGNEFFFSTGFAVNASNGGTSQQTDTVSFDVLANPGLAFSSIMVTAFGSYAITTEGSVDVVADLSMSENPGAGSLERTFTGSLNTDVAFPINTPGSGVWNGDAAVNVEFVFPSPHNDIHISLFNDVIAIAGPQGSAAINIQFQDLMIGFVVVPEPASLALLTLGGGLLLIRRRR